MSYFVEKKDKPRIVKRTWTEEEDARLLELVKIHGLKEWYVLVDHIYIIYICSCTFHIYVCFLHSTNTLSISPVSI